MARTRRRFWGPATLSYAFGTAGANNGMQQYNYKTAPRTGAAPDDALPPVNLLVCVSRLGQESEFAQTVARLSNQRTLVYHLKLDLTVQQQSLLDAFAVYTFTRLVRSTDPHVLGFAVEDPALLDIGEHSHLLKNMMFRTVLRSYVERHGTGQCNIHILVGNSLGQGHDISIAACERLQVSLNAVFNRPGSVRVVCNSMLPDQIVSGPSPYSAPALTTMSPFFDVEALQTQPLTPSERGLLNMLTSRLAYASDLRSMIAGYKVMNVMDKVTTVERSFSEIQSRILNQDVSCFPRLINSIVHLEDRLERLVSELQSTERTLVNVYNTQYCTPP